MRILVVEDERLLCDGIAEDLRLEKYTVDCCYDGPAACERLFVEPYDLVVLDLNLPGMDGLELLRHIRTEQPELRVLILSARSQLSDKVAGLDLGADDYLTKPFALEELEARVRTLLRREFRQRESLVQVGALTLNTVTREVSGRGEPLPLTPREFAILEHLMLHRGCWISQEELMEHIWEADANPFSNAVRMHISSLRKKLRKRLGHDPIQTKVGRGYRLAGNAELLRQAVCNLVENAVKYSPAGSVVHIAGHRDGEWFQIVVADQGPGIPESLRQRIFEPFFRVDDSRSRQLGGAGLGLALVRAIAEFHGGAVYVEKSRGAGSRFVLKLPCEQDPPPD